MAAHCPYCNSTDITPMVSPPPRNIPYFHCNDPDCGRNFITPVYDTESVAEPAELSLTGEAQPVETLE